MKVCPNCGAEYQDQDAYCSKCGTKLDATNVCQKCGHPVSIEETFCRHCGHKIEKELRCEKCGAVIEENAKFCPQCGEKTENPVVSIKRKEGAVKNSEPTKVASLANKILFWSIGGTLLFFLVLMFIGCFGDLLAVNVRGAASPTAGSSLMNGEYTRSIKYFFGDAIKQIKQESADLDNGGYQFFATMMFVFELLAWIGAIIAIVVSTVFMTINLVNGAKKEFKLRTKPFLVAGGFVANYLFLLGVQNATYMEVVEKTSSYVRTWNVDLTFGWGTKTMLLCLVLGVIAIVAFKILLSIFNKKNIVKNSVIGGLVFILIIALMTSIGQVVGLDYKGTGNTVTGSCSVYSCYTNDLYQNCMGGKELAGYAVQCLIGTFMVLGGYVLFYALIQTLLSSKRSKTAVTAFAITSSLCLLIGHIVSFIGANESMKASDYYNYTYAPAGVVLPLFAIAAMVGFFIVISLKQNAKQA